MFPTKCSIIFDHDHFDWTYASINIQKLNAVFIQTNQTRWTNRKIVNRLEKMKIYRINEILSLSKRPEQRKMSFQTTANLAEHLKHSRRIGSFKIHSEGKKCIVYQWNEVWLRMSSSIRHSNRVSHEHLSSKLVVEHFSVWEHLLEEDVWLLAWMKSKKRKMKAIDRWLRNFYIDGKPILLAARYCRAANNEICCWNTEQMSCWDFQSKKILTMRSSERWLFLMMIIVPSNSSGTSWWNIKSIKISDLDGWTVVLIGRLYQSIRLTIRW